MYLTLYLPCRSVDRGEEAVYLTLYLPCRSVDRGEEAVCLTLYLPCRSVDREGPQSAVELLRDSGFAPDALKSAVAERLRAEAANHGLLLPAAGAEGSQAAAPPAPSQPDTVRRPAVSLIRLLGWAFPWELSLAWCEINVLLRTSKVHRC